MSATPARVLILLSTLAVVHKRLAVIWHDVTPPVTIVKKRAHTE